MKSIVLGSKLSDHIEISVLGYELQPSGEYYDDNWLSCQVRAKAGAFSGGFSTNFLTGELLGLYEGLQKLYRDLKGEISFDPLESQLVLTFQCDMLGHIHVCGFARDQAGTGNELSIDLSFDQTYLDTLLSSFAELMRAYPVRT